MPSNNDQHVTPKMLRIPWNPTEPPLPVAYVPFFSEGLRVIGKGWALRAESRRSRYRIGTLWRMSNA